MNKWRQERSTEAVYTPRDGPTPGSERVLTRWDELKKLEKCFKSSVKPDCGCHDSRH